MKNYICKWSNGDVVLVSARNRQEVRLILDEVADPGRCEIKHLKGPFAIELNPKLPARPADNSQRLSPFQEPGEQRQDPTARPQVQRWATNRGATFYSDVWKEAGGELSPEEEAALQRWRTAAAAAEAGPWVTEGQLQDIGLLDNPYYLEVELGKQEYGRYTSRLNKQITKSFFPKTYEALKTLQAAQEDGDDTQAEAVAINKLRAAVAADVDSSGEESMRREAKLWVDAQAGDARAMAAVMTDQSANVYGTEEGDSDDDSDASGDTDSSDGGFDFMQGLRAGRALEIAAMLGARRGGAA